MLGSEDDDDDDRPIDSFISDSGNHLSMVVVFVL